jgi:hypothetical protein
MGESLRGAEEESSSVPTASETFRQKDCCADTTLESVYTHQRG